MNTVANIALPKPVTVDELNAYVAAAELEYGNYKSSAMKSAANAYLVWHHGESVNAEPTMRTWLDGQIAARNTLIDAHNKAVDDAKRRAKECAEGKINDPLTEEATAVLLAMHKRKPSEWAAHKQVKIEGRDGSSNFTRIVKFVFGFKKPSDASHVSRYAKVLEYIEQHKNELGGDFSVDAIVALLNEVGGFEAAIDKVRNPEAANDDNVRAATLTKIKEAVDRAEGGEEIAFTPKYEQNGYVFLVGRPSANGVKLCGELAINDNEANDLMFKVDAAIIGSADPAVEFISRVVSIGDLVREGREGNAVDTAGTGKRFKVARTFSLTDLGSKTQVVVSARYTEASVVIHAAPKANVNIGKVEPDQAALLNSEDAAYMAKHFSSAARCLLMTINASQGDSDIPVRWNVTTALDGKDQNKAIVWSSMYKEAHCPVDKRHFDPKCSMTLTQEQLRLVYNDCLRDWGKNKQDDQKANKQLTVKFDGVTLTVGHVVYGIKSYPLGDKLGSPVSLDIRPRDIVDLFAKLIELNVPFCTLHGDADGMLAISWDDEVGDYTVYQPVVDMRGGLSKTCVGYMKVSK
ncbi:hypothetical protein AQZ52_02010 [Novosphingobium fuchskuhlense]|uniref:Uncharacterized protein n=1 Tax=Novosphingobium fuchskuhlense TaxID=1117702 RepID=A0A117UWF4_9SPHN|nr:hypothetical protein [Novosphingobium fuchskuhlense]KUR72105.1 hypothetical protein AQZ52_02010 [Novosphingobium fuchskuhlense]